MNKIVVKIKLICLACLILTSCNDLDQHPIHQFTDGNFWETEARALIVLSQAYNQMYGAGVMFDNEGRTDNLYDQTPSTYLQGTADVSLNTFADEWRDCYQGIRTCNILLDNIDYVPMDPDRKERMKAEARFIRAFLYFRLATWFNHVPHSEGMITLSEARTMGRKPYADVMAWVRSELNAVAEILPTKQEYSAADNGRITKGAAMGMLARTYLWDNDWQNTDWRSIANITERIMNGEFGTYDLFPSYEGLFRQANEYNQEIMMCVGYVPIDRTWNQLWDGIPQSQLGRHNNKAPTQELVDSYVMLNGLPITDPNSGYQAASPYANRDPRFRLTVVHHGYEWIRPDGSVEIINIDPASVPEGQEPGPDIYQAGAGSSPQTGYYLRKWWCPDAQQDGQASGLNIIMLRYADILLMHAEAKNELDEMNEAVWDETVRKVRERAGFTYNDALDWRTLSKTALRDIIRGERRSEFAIEGTRVFDLRRWRLAEIVMNGRPTAAPYANPALTLRSFNPARDYFWPVPQSQIDINPNLLPNNQGWGN